MDRIDQFRIFIRVAHSGGFTVAADQLGLPRPTVSLAIQQLEARLGTRLFNRTTRRVGLTQDGEALLERAIALVADSEELEQQFRLPAKALTGRLRVDMPSRIARRQVAPALPDFFARYPGIQVDLGSSDRAIDLVHEGIDCALRIGEVPSSSLVARPLGALRLVNCASPAYLARHGMPQAPADLSRHLAVNYASPSSGRGVPWEWTENGRLQTLAMKAQVSVNNVETYLACCLAGMGLIQIPAFDVREHLEAGELVEVLQAWPAPSMPARMIYPHRRHLSRRVQAFSVWLAGILSPFLEAAPPRAATGTFSAPSGADARARCGNGPDRAGKVR
ncbi:LysR family transcriptional regulator [Thauera linaloolentis]|uniref:LysR family transcriptional regulator n=1 Tax=Thauera linaloolentis (strain DSM 12138 / JCM 21573 / CCUG 41526 / CIP 105981 / IAM 15112 / NBRC 102519 / 47Lol) TaxID=1123367 RepID=N6XS76_THAL4|nr:LysR family transcriptional regulator [Thauera linaloolentis]ENO84586.1 LysR family transcriptional regulator [Thauera linaloolentis 47Lol = DSM 12138]MCM8564233.1 LysR family transcriptional regulator [Thauera linaloolentis]